MNMGKAQMNWRTAAVAAVVGGAVMFLAAQLLAKPTLDTPARANATGIAVTRARSGRLPIGRANPRTRITRVAASRGALAADPPLRELFRPLISDPARHQAGRPLPKGRLPRAPILPNAGLLPHPAGIGTRPAAPDDPVGAALRDLRMLGVVEMDGQPEVLLKKISTGESRRVAQGQSAFGFTVRSIQSTEVSLVPPIGKPQRLAMSSDILVEGPGSAGAAASSGFSGGGDGGSRGGRGRRQSPEDASSAVVAQIMSPSSWQDRLKKLEELKGQIDTEQYTRLKNFFAKKLGK